jgi:hypothetical protein
MEEKRMIKYYYIATYVLAFIAVIGFVYSIKTSNDTAEIAKSMQESSNDVSKTLYGMKEAFKAIQDNFVLLTTPNIKIIKINLITDDDKINLSCNHPPIGLGITYKNTSNITIQVTDISMKLYWGLSEFKEIHEIVGTSEIILSPAGTDYRYRIDTKNFKNYLGEPKKDIKAPPHMGIIFSVCYSDIAHHQKYMYTAKYEIRYNCTDGENIEFILQKESNNIVNYTKFDK